MKTIDDRYAEGHRGALFTVTTAEEAWKLGGLERFLTPAVREQLSSLQDLRYSCDNNMQLAHDALAMSRVAADYSELRRALFCDSTQHAEEPPWRVCQRNSLAMRIRPRLHRCAKAALVLSRDRRHVLTQAESWTFTTLANSHDPKDEGTAYPVTLYPFPKGDDQVKDEYLLDAPAELEEHDEWYRQLFYAFLALGMQVRLGAVTHEDVKFRVINGRTTKVDGNQPPTSQA